MTSAQLSGGEDGIVYILSNLESLTAACHTHLAIEAIDYRIVLVCASSMCRGCAGGVAERWTARGWLTGWKECRCASALDASGSALM